MNADDNTSWYPLIVAQYDLEANPRRTEHWGLAVLRSRQDAEIFEVVGMSDTFNYAPRHELAFSRDPQLRGGCLVGRVRSDKLDWMREALRNGVAVVRYSVTWDCQVWVMDALRYLKNAAEDREEGLEIDMARERPIQMELVLERERWATGEDTVEERLFAA